MSAPNDSANRLKGLIQVAKKDMALDDDNYRLILYSVAGKSSTKQMTVSELRKVLDAFVANGFVVTAKAKPNPKVVPINKDVKLPNRKPRNNDPRLKKIWKLWYLLAEHGQCKGNSKSLNAFCKRQVGVENMDWLKTHEDYRAVIEGLKDWCTRVGINLGVC